MRRPFKELAPTTIQTYRSRARKLWLKVQSDQATRFDLLELAELEALLRRAWKRHPAAGTATEVVFPNKSSRWQRLRLLQKFCGWVRIICAWGKNRCSAREFALAGGLARTRCALPLKTTCDKRIHQLSQQGDKIAGGTRSTRVRSWQRKSHLTGRNRQQQPPKYAPRQGYAQKREEKQKEKKERKRETKR